MKLTIPLALLAAGCAGRDLNGKWRVRYAPPPGSTGGPIAIDIDKRTGEDIWVSMEQ